MFGSLKKRLKEAVDKVSKSISKEDQPQFKDVDDLLKHPEEPVPVETKEQPEEKEEIKPEHETKHVETKAEKKKTEETKHVPNEGQHAADEDQHEPGQQEESLFTPGEKEEEYKEEEEIITLDEQIDKKIADLKDLKEKVAEEKLPPDIVESKIETQEAAKEEKKRHGFSFFKKVSEKRLTDSEVEKILKELHIALLENDVAVAVADKISDDVKNKLSGAVVKRGKVEDTIKDALRYAMLDVMRQDKIELDRLIEKKDGPYTIMMIGFNGTGKTTTLCKLAHKFKKYKPVLAAADTFRAASIEQLEEHSKKLDMRVVKHTYGADSAAVIFDAKKHAAASGNKLVMADTAGRSHSNVNLMDELKKIVRVNSPDMKILVLDSVTGNDIYDQCRLFNDAVGVDAIILTKADVYEKGGAALSAAYTLKKPILYIGIGQGYDDLKEFDSEEIVNNLLK